MEVSYENRFKLTRDASDSRHVFKLELLQVGI